MNVHLPYATHCFNDHRTYLVITFKSSKYLQPTRRTNDNVLVFFSFLFFSYQVTMFSYSYHLFSNFQFTNIVFSSILRLGAQPETSSSAFLPSPLNFLHSTSTLKSSLNLQPSQHYHHSNNNFVSSYLTLKIVLIFHLCTEFFNGYVIVPFSPMCAVLYTFILIFSKHLYIN